MDVHRISMICAEHRHKVNILEIDIPYKAF
jgi:hypothetical protein